MSGRIRVLVVDDSVVARRQVTVALEPVPDMEVVAVAPNGELALRKIAQGAPDAVVLDLEMPGIGGLETITRIRKLRPDLPIIVFSASTPRGALETLDALERGASECVTKPTGCATAEEALARVRSDLVPVVRALCAGVAARRVAVPPVPAPAADGAGSGDGGRRFADRVDARPVSLVVIGSSTGGPNALATVIAGLPVTLSVPIVIAQHMPPDFTRYLAERLDGLTALRVREASGEHPLEPGNVWLAPGGRHLAVRPAPFGARLEVTDEPRDADCRPSVDVLFGTAADVLGSRVLGVILTGMGHDGTAGARVLRDAGGSVVVQDQASSVVWGMPGTAVSAGLVDEVLPLDQVAGAIADRIAFPAWR